MTTANDFAKSGFTIIRNMVQPSETERLYRYTLDNMTAGNMDDGQVPGSPSFYQDKEVMALQNRLLPMIESSIQSPLLPIFCYHRIYRTGAILRMHKDSSRAQISVTINLGQTGNPWDLWLIDYHENTHAVTLSPGDGLIYYGSKLHHWRGQLMNSDLVSQIMFHFVFRTKSNAWIAKMEMIRKIRHFLISKFSR